MSSFPITRKIDLNAQDYLIEVEAPHVAGMLKPGQFVVLMTHEKGERIPMSVQKAEDGRITMFIKRLGKTSLELDDYRVGDCFYQVIGPMGNAFPIKQYGTVVWCSDLVCGHAENYAYCEALHRVNGNHIISIQTFPTKADVYLEEELRAVSHEHHITTIDGSHGARGHYNDLLRSLLQKQRIDLVMGCGDIKMLKEMADITRQHGVPARSVLRQIMVDATGMCGACRVFIDGEMKLTCIDGPLFDAHKVNFNEVINRLNMFKQPEAVAKEAYLKAREAK